MFTALIGHGPLYRSKARQVGRLFTPAVTVAFVVLLVILLTAQGVLLRRKLHRLEEEKL